MEYNYSKSVTIPGQTIPLRLLLSRFTNGVPIDETLFRQGTYTFNTPPKGTDEDFAVDFHDVNEIDITIAQAKAERVKSNLQNMKKQKHNTSLSDKDDVNVSIPSNTAPTNNVGE